jgi:heptosyltransferase I
MLRYYRPSFIILSHIISFLLWVPLRIINVLVNRSGSSRSPVHKILVQDGYLLGDVILYSRALVTLRAAFPAAEIHLITHPAACDLLKSSGWVNGLIPFAAPWQSRTSFFKAIMSSAACIRRLRGEKYDMAIDLHGDIRGLAFLFLCGIKQRVSFSDFGGRPWCTASYATPASARHQSARCSYLIHCIAGTGLDQCVQLLWPTQAVDTAFSGSAVPPGCVLVHPATFNPEKQWPVERFAQVIDMIRDREKREVVIIAGEADATTVNAVVSRLKNHCLVEYPLFYMLEQLLKRASVLVCLDSFVQHAAAALETPMVVLYGPSSPHYVAPCEGIVRVVWNDRIIKPPYHEWNGARPVSANSCDTVVKAVAGLLQKETR